MSEQTNNSEYNTVTLSLDDGTECECAIIRIFPAGENDYIALLPLEGEAAEQDEVYLYRYVENDGREPSLLNIESDEEYELVSEAFDEELDAMEYEDLYAQEDEENEEAYNASSLKIIPAAVDIYFRRDFLFILNQFPYGTASVYFL